ncbi:UNVERIFIED_CONTAM: hypothetical protein GTU68_034226 [Idotea baltica]|nr:hypothetical protein [Idotea baltica]
MLTTSGRSWAEKLLSQLPMANCTSARGNTSFTTNSMAVGANEF